jgi:hypothetical protein
MQRTLDQISYREIEAIARDLRRDAMYAFFDRMRERLRVLSEKKAQPAPGRRVASVGPQGC